MRFLGVHHLVYGLNHEQQRYRFLEYYLQSDFRDQIKSITNRHADVGVFDFPGGVMAPMIRTSIILGFLAHQVTT